MAALPSAANFEFMSSGRHASAPLEWDAGVEEDQDDLDARFQRYHDAYLNGELDEWNVDLLEPLDRDEVEFDWETWGANEVNRYLDSTHSHDPLTSSSTLDENSPPSRARETRLPRLRSPSPASSTPPRRPMGNASSATNITSLNHTEHPPQPHSHRPPTTNQPSRSTALRTQSSRPPSPDAPDPFDHFYFDEWDHPHSSPDSFDGIDIDDLLASDGDEGEEPEPETMPASRRTRPRGEHSIVDLTRDSSPPPRNGAARPPATSTTTTSSRKRPAPSTTPSQPRKRKRRSSSSASSALSSPTKIEELDLTTEESLLQHQRESAIKAQQSNPDGGSQSIGKRQCMVCLDHFTNATVTHCGHIYCHECLTQALRAGEKNSERSIGNCPACRKPVSLKKNGQMIVVNFMKRSAFVGKGGRAG